MLNDIKPTLVNNPSKQITGWELYENILNSPKYIVAPMVDQSELAWRMLCRKHNAHLCYTPMFHSNLFSKDIKYRKESLQTCPEDRPLIIQFCGNDPKIILEAAILAQDHCDAIDINLGCPQSIAKRGHYGAFLQEDWKLLTDIVSTLSKNLKVPVTCKIRIFEDINKTIQYAKMLERAGCKLLTIHGRTREQKGPLTGLADWKYIKTVRDNIHIPIFANGNILCLRDVERCFQETGVQGVMSAEGNLYNPGIFEEKIPITWEIADEYLDFVEIYPCQISYIRGHLFKLFNHLLNLKPNAKWRELLAVAREMPQFRQIVTLLREKYEPFHTGKLIYTNEESDPLIYTVENTYNLSLPPWLCQGYIRPLPEVHKKTIDEKIRIAADPSFIKRQYFDNDGNEISRKKMKRLRRKNRRPVKAEGQKGRNLEECTQCLNPLGLKCEFKLCRTCCKDICYRDKFDCPGHKIFLKTRKNILTKNQLDTFTKKHNHNNENTMAKT